MPRTFRSKAMLVVAGTLLLFAPLAATPQIGDAPARFAAFAVNMNRGAAGSVELVINRWSSDADRDRLMSVMFDKGQERLLQELQKMPRMGYIRTPGRVGWDIHFAAHVPAKDGGERIVLVTDRHMGFREVANRHRSVDYPFTIIELNVPKSGDGDGDGKITEATRIIPDKGGRIVTLENYDIQPVLLTKVTRERAS